MGFIKRWIVRNEWKKAGVISADVLVMVIEDIARQRGVKDKEWIVKLNDDRSVSIFVKERIYPKR